MKEFYEVYELIVLDYLFTVLKFESDIMYQELV